MKYPTLLLLCCEHASECSELAYDIREQASGCSELAYDIREQASGYRK